jgi:hypothetical protein
MAIIGAILGFFVAGAIVIGFFPNMSDLLLYAIWIGIIFLFAFWGAKMKEKIDLNTLPQDKLTKKEVQVAWIFSLINPVITGAVMYFMWHQTYPIKARQANQISFLAFFLWIGFYFFYFWVNTAVK